MALGDRVRILPSVNYGGRFTARLGTVIYMSGLCPGKLGVKIDGLKNQASKYEAYWFSMSDVEIIESEEMYMPKEYKTASIQFLNGANHGTLYTYALYDDDIAVDDLVVVKIGHHGLALAKVVEINPEVAAPVKYGRQIAAKVDLSAYEARVQRAKRLSKLKQEMDAKVKELQTTAIYELLAEKDPALSAMLAEYKSITAGQAWPAEEDENESET